MSATFDATTTGEYSAATTAAARSAVIVAALTGTISVKVFNGSNTEMGSGTMAAPWATASGATVTIGEVSSFTVGTTATPDSNWYIRFQNAGATRWVRGSFGLAGSGQDFTWSLDTWTATHTGTIGTATITTTGNAAPAFTVAPTTKSLPSSGGTIQFTAVDPEGVAVTYSMSTRTGFSISPTTGLVTVTSAAAGTSGNITVTASDGVLTVSTVCAVTVAAASGATFTIPTTLGTYNAGAVQPGDTIVVLRGSGTRGPLKITGAVGTSTNRIRVINESGGLLTISGVTTFVLNFENCRYVDAIFNNSMTTETIGGKSISYGLFVTVPSAGDNFTSLIKTSGTTSFLRIGNFKLDGKWTTYTTGQSRVGIQTYDSIGRSSGTTPVWTQSIEISDFYLRRVSGEGIYGGGNFYNAAIACNRNMSYHDGVIEDTGREGIQAKSWLEGTNEIYNIDCRRVGRNASVDEPNQTSGISVLDGKANIYNCRVFEAGGQGIQYYNNGVFSTGNALFENYGPYTTMVSECYNNVSADGGQVTPSASKDGITVGAAAGAIKPNVHVYSNSVANNPGDGISTNGNASASCVVENNIILGNTGSATSLSVGGTGVGNYTTGTAAATFTAPTTEDFSLIAERAAAGTLGTNYPATDIDGTSRAGTASRGAYEYA